MMKADRLHSLAFWLWKRLWPLCYNHYAPLVLFWWQCLTAARIRTNFKILFVGYFHCIVLECQTLHTHRGRCMQTGNRRNWEPQLGLLVCRVQWWTAHVITLLVVGLLLTCTNGFRDVSDLYWSWDRGFLLSLSPCPGLAGTVYLILSSENETK